jgi:hypothetical protein
MAIKKYDDWSKEQSRSVRPEEVYEAGIKAAKNHYEEEFVATAEYFDSVLRRTSDINFDIALKLVEVADIIPMVGDPVDPSDYKMIFEGLMALKEAVKEHKNDPSVQV